MKDDWRLLPIPDYKMDEMHSYDPENDIISRLDGDVGEEEDGYLDLIFSEDSSILTPGQKVVLWHRLIDGMTYDQIGKIIGTSRQNVYEMYNKALKNLKMVGDPNDL